MKIEILIGLFICHFLADYTYLSTKWMLNAKRFGKPLFPIFAHALVHTLLMGAFLFIMGSENILLLLLIQLFSHFLIDLWKGRMNVWFPRLQNSAKTEHWIIFGLDQLLHSIVLISMYAISVQ